jgi:hypothetical protein
MENGFDGPEPTVPDRPGKSLHRRPIEVGQEFYDPLHPPTHIRLPDGTDQYVGGRKIDKDDVYAERFWEKHQYKGLKESMMGNIRNTLDKGYFGYFASDQGIDEQDKERLSAYRKLAKEIGYEIGQFTYNPKTHEVIAPLSPIQQGK